MLPSSMQVHSNTVPLKEQSRRTRRPTVDRRLSKVSLTNRMHGNNGQ